MEPRDQVIRLSRVIAGLIRLARNSREPGGLVEQAQQWLERLWDFGCHSDKGTVHDKETARRCVVALERML